MTTLSSGFALFASKQFDGPPEIITSAITYRGILAAGFPILSGTLIACPGGRFTAPTSMGAASEVSGSGRAFVVYSNVCTGGHKVAATGWDLARTKVQFNVSD